MDGLDVVSYILQAIIFSAAIPFLSYFQYKLAGKKAENTEIRRKTGFQVLKFRYFAGLSMGCFDHFFMIIGGWHPGELFVPWAFWYVTVIYMTVNLCIPSNLNEKWRKPFILAWLCILITIFTILEINIHYIFNIPYPNGWTELTTLIFYFDVFLLGTFIATLHWSSRFLLKSS